jgi:hypothetical protein
MRSTSTMFLGVVLLLAAGSASAQRESAVACTDNGTVLISKDVGTDRWAISYRPTNGSTTGNVYAADGGAIFLECERESITNGAVNLSCATSPGCGATECPPFEPIGGTVSIACSFFTAPCSKTVSTFSSSATCSGSPVRPPYDSEASCAAFAARYGCYEYEYTSGRCAVSFCCTAASCDDP